MKTKGKVLSLLAMVVLTVCMCVCFAACGSSVAGTYTFKMTGSEIKGKTSAGGFVDSMIDLGVITGQTNTLVLNGNNTYELTKEVEFDLTNESAGGQDMAVKYVFTGDYTYEGNTVTLSPSTYCTAYETWGAASAYLGDKDLDSDEDETLLGYFSTQYWVQGGNSEQVVTIDTENFTFAY